MNTSQPPDFPRLVSASRLRMRARAPFFATLAMFARLEVRHDLPTAATDGRDVFFNPDFITGLSSAELDGLMLHEVLHEVLHAALLHIPRRGGRDPLLWNVAADIVVNGIIANETPFVLPPDLLRETELEKFSVEEVYEILQRDLTRVPSLEMLDLLEAAPDEGNLGGALGDERRRILETYWRNAREQALAIARSFSQGNLPAGMAREAGALNPAQIDWRSYLWRYLVRTPVDFQNFDRRFVGRGLYLEALEGETVRVFVAVDTSGSINSDQINIFLSEVIGILQSYPHLRCDLFYVDAAAHGPFPLGLNDPVPRPVGGGGTDFRPFFDAVAREGDDPSSSVCVYLTDGFGTFPEQVPAIPVLWVVTAGGLGLEKFPFGETVRLTTNF